MFARVAHGLGYTPRVQFTCLVPLAHPIARLPVAKSPSWLPGYARIRCFSRAWLSVAHGRRFGGNLGRRRVARAGSCRNGESFVRAPSSVESFTYKATPLPAVASSSVPSPLLQSREIPAEVVWWYIVSRPSSLAGFLFVPLPWICCDSVPHLILH